MREIEAKRGSSLAAAPEPTGSAPRRWIAVVAALLTPLGVGHVYAGMPRRALAWFFGLTSAIVLASSSLTVFAPGWGLSVAFGAWLALLAASWLGPALDLALLPGARFTRVPLAHVLGFAICAVFLGTLVKTGIRSMIIEAFKIPSGGMAPSLELQDHVMVDKWHYGPVVPWAERRLFRNQSPRRGDPVVFAYPYAAEGDEQDFAKRVIAIGGDTLALDGDQPIINGWRVPRCVVARYANGGKQGQLFVEFLDQSSYLVWAEDVPFPRRLEPRSIAPGESWVLGDNRNNSADSASWNQGLGGGVPDAKIKGRALFVWLAFDGVGRVKWQRIGADLLGRPHPPTGAAPEVVAGIERCLSARPAQTLPPSAAGAL